MIEMTRLSGWIAWIVVLALAVPAFGPVIDGRFLPVRIDQRVSDVTRTDTALCWTWTSLKLRVRTSDNLDAFAVFVPRDARDAEREVVAPWDETTRRGWTKALARPVTGQPDHQRWCITLPASADRNTPIRLEQTAYYPGSLPLWHVVLRLPDVVDPAGAGVR